MLALPQDAQHALLNRTDAHGGTVAYAGSLQSTESIGSVADATVTPKTDAHVVSRDDTSTSRPGGAEHLGQSNAEKMDVLLQHLGQTHLYASEQAAESGPAFSFTPADMCSPSLTIYPYIMVIRTSAETQIAPT